MKINLIVFRVILIISVLSLIIRCSDKKGSDKNDKLNLQAIYSKHGISVVENFIKREDSETLLYRLNLYTTGSIKDSTRIAYGEDEEPVDIKNYSYYKDGKEHKFYSEEQFSIKLQYEYEGRHYFAYSVVEEHEKDKKGRYIYQRKEYDGKHEFITRFSYSDTSRTEIEYGPIGDIIKNKTYFIDNNGQDYKAKNNLTKQYEPIKKIIFEDVFVYDGKTVEISIINSEEEAYWNSCYIEVTDTTDKYKTIVYKMECENGSTVEEIRKRILSKSGFFNLTLQEETIVDDFGNWLVQIMINGNKDTIFYSNRALIFNKNNSIKQANYFNKNGVLRSKAVYSYDENGRIIKRNRIDLEDNDIKIKEYIYDERGLLNEEKETENGEWLRSVKYLYR